MNISAITVHILSVITLVTAMRDFEQIIDQEQSLTLALATIILDFHVKQSNTIFITKYSTSTLDGTQSILRNIFTTFDANLSVTWIIRDQDYLNDTIESVNNIIFADSYESLRSFFKSITKKSIEYFGYYTIILTNVYENQEAILTNIFQDFWNNDIINVNILTYSHESKTGPVLLYTYFPFTPQHCGKVVPVIWNYFEDGHFVDNKKQFPLKMENLYQCPVSILVAPIQPYIYITKTYSNDTYDLEGIEYNLLHALSERMNFKPQFSIHWNPNIGMVLDNGTVTEALGMVSEKKVNMTVGALIYTARSSVALTASKSYSFEDMVLVIPNPGPYSSFEKLFFPFTGSMWILISVTLMIAMVVIKVLEHSKREYYELVIGSNITSPYLNLIRVLLTGGGVKESTETFSRFLLMIWILTCVVLQNVYQGQLFTFIKANKMKNSAQSIDELIERNISIKLIEENYEMFLEFDKRIEKLLKYVDSKTTFEYVTENEGYITLETHLFDETRRNSYDRPKTLKIATFSHILYLPKHSYLKESLDDEITFMNENGLTSKWTAPYKESAMFDPIDESIPRKLNISQILGIVEVWFGLLMIATILFILEILFRYCEHIIKANT